MRTTSTLKYIGANAIIAGAAWTFVGIDGCNPSAIYLFSTLLNWGMLSIPTIILIIMHFPFYRKGSNSTKMAISITSILIEIWMMYNSWAIGLKPTGGGWNILEFMLIEFLTVFAIPLVFLFVKLLVELFSKKQTWSIKPAPKNDD